MASYCNASGMRDDRHARGSPRCRRRVMNNFSLCTDCWQVLLEFRDANSKLKTVTLVRSVGCSSTSAATGALSPRSHAISTSSVPKVLVPTPRAAASMRPSSPEVAEPTAMAADTAQALAQSRPALLPDISSAPNHSPLRSPENRTTGVLFSPPKSGLRSPRTTVARSFRACHQSVGAVFG